MFVGIFSSWISNSASSWLDDYFDWLDPNGAPLCCRIDKTNQHFCPSSDRSPNCVSCNPKLIDGRPNAKDFIHYLPFFLSQNPGPSCPKAYVVFFFIFNLTLILWFDSKFFNFDFY